MMRLLGDICDSSAPVRAPAPLLVWIPKADAGTKADNWRPLGMPSTFLRTFAAAMYVHTANTLPTLLHPAQALLNTFREPQGNYQDSLAHLWQRPPNRAQLSTILITDFMKAFEMINPDYLMEVLWARQAPLWLMACTQFVLYGRKVIPKIQGLTLLH